MADMENFYNDLIIINLYTLSRMTLGTGKILSWTMSDMVKYRATIWSFLKSMALYFTMFVIVHIFRY